MAPKKKGEKMSLGDFLGDGPTSWADEMEDMPISDSRFTSFGGGASKSSYGGNNMNTYSTGTMSGYSVREELPLPSKPPYTVHLGNLSFEATSQDVEDFFTGCECTNVRIIEDKMEMKPKGFGYAEFASIDGLKQALTLNGSTFQGRNIRISIAEPAKDRDGPTRSFDDWTRKGPLPDLPGRGGGDRGGERRPSEYNSGGRERREQAFEGDGRTRDFGNWERRGPLSPLAQPERSFSGSGSRDGGRPTSDDGPQKDLGDRRASPAAWGEGRPQGSQDGSRPPRREFQERPPMDRAPTAAEQDNQWRTKMRPDAPPSTTAPIPSREGSEAPGSPAQPPAQVGRPKLNLAKRTVSEAPEQSPSSTNSDAKASPFGAARPIDTAAKEKELEQKRLAAIEEKKEAEDKAKADREAARVAAKAAEEAKEEAADNQETAHPSKGGESQQSNQEKQNIDDEKTSGEKVNDSSTQPKEALREAPKPSQGAWRRPEGGAPLNEAPRDDGPRGSRGRGDGSRGGRGGPDRGRGGAMGRGSRNYDGNRTPRLDTNGGVAYPQSPNTPVDSETATLEEDGWSTVSKAKKGGRTGGQASRGVAS